MRFSFYERGERRIGDEHLVGLAERVNQRLGRPLESAVLSLDLFDQAAIEGLIEPVPLAAQEMGEHLVHYSRAKLQQLARRHSRHQPPATRHQPPQGDSHA